MNTTECIRTRRSIRKFKPDPIDHFLLESIISTASYSPSWKNSQIVRYIAIEDSSILNSIMNNYTPDFNSNIIRQAPMLIAMTFVKGRCGFERDWINLPRKRVTAGRCSMQASRRRRSALPPMRPGLGPLSWESGMRMASRKLLDFPKDQELAALIAIGYPDIHPDAPGRKSVDELLTYR